MSYGHLGRRVDAELQLRLLAVGEGLALNEEGGATVGELPDVIEDKVDVILARRADLVHHGGLQAQEDDPGKRKSAQFNFRTSLFQIDQIGFKILTLRSPGPVFAGASYTEEGGEVYVIRLAGVGHKQLAFGLLKGVNHMVSDLVLGVN